jgi:hypothetical protein
MLYLSKTEEDLVVIRPVLRLVILMRYAFKLAQSGFESTDSQFHAKRIRSRITKYICSLRSKSTKCSRPRLAGPKGPRLCLSNPLGSHNGKDYNTCVYAFCRLWTQEASNSTSSTITPPPQTNKPSFHLPSTHQLSVCTTKDFLV